MILQEATTLPAFAKLFEKHRSFLTGVAGSKTPPSYHCVSAAANWCLRFISGLDFLSEMDEKPLHSGICADALLE